MILGGLWPRVARVHLPQNAIKFDKVSGGTVQRENVAKEYKMFDLRDERVFLHPSSVLFNFAAWRSQYVVYFSKVQTTKLFLRDATEVREFRLDEQSFESQAAGPPLRNPTLRRACLCESNRQRSYYRRQRRDSQVEGLGSNRHSCQRSPVRLCINFHRRCLIFLVDSRLLDAQLQRSIEESSVLASGRNNHVIQAMLALLSHDGAAAPS